MTKKCKDKTKNWESNQRKSLWPKVIWNKNGKRSKNRENKIKSKGTINNTLSWIKTKTSTILPENYWTKSFESFL